MKPHHNPIRPQEALDGIRALIRDPDDTAQVFKIIRALAGNSLEKQFARFRSSEHGPRILAEKRALVDALSDRGYLLSLADGSLGRVYADFTAREQISAAGLVEASEATPADTQPPCAERQLFGARLRDSHDLWHVLTGYGRDVVGEAALLAFTYRQIRNRGIGFIVCVAYLKAGRVFPQERAMIRDGFRRAGKAAWLPGADWEALLPRPLAEVRQILRIEPVGDYEPLRSEGAPSIA